jgi:hypothetical protein
VELFEAIRRDHRREGLSVRALAARHEVHRRTVRQALDSAVPPARKSYPRPAPAIGPWTAVIDEWLVKDQDAPRKQRHTARRIWQRLGSEHSAVLSEVTVSRYVRRRRVELGLTPPVEVMVAQDHEPGAEGEVDFGEFYAEIGGSVRTSGIASDATSPIRGHQFHRGAWRSIRSATRRPAGLSPAKSCERPVTIKCDRAFADVGSISGRRWRASPKVLKSNGFGRSEHGNGKHSETPTQPKKR